MNLDAIPAGTGGRWAMGVVILIHLVAYSDTGGPGAVFSSALAALCSIYSAICRSGLKHLQIPYIRASHKVDFLLLFLALWLDILSLLAGCGALARTLSTCLDAMTGGLARMWILGRNSSENEPWPDVLGVAIVFLVTGMFMLGLEHTKVFSCLMVSAVLGVAGILALVTWLRGNINAWKIEPIIPTGVKGLTIGTALITFTYPSEMPSIGSYKRLKGFLIILIVLLSNLLTAGCLSTVMQYSPHQDFSATPLLSLLEVRDLHKVVPAMACLLVIACSGSLMELFSEMFNIVVRLASAEWKILAKQIGLENSESGSPVLAIFTGGSLCAMLAFACPLENLTHIQAASFLGAGIFRAFYLIYSPFRPKYIPQQGDSSLSYSRLDAIQTIKTQTSWRKSLLCCFGRNTTISSALPKSKSKINKNKRDEELEREWLLLGEPPSSPRATVCDHDAESSILSDGDPPECSHQKPDTESDSSTDIDAIVDEYRQKVKVSTAGPMDKTLRVPSLGSWRLSLFGCIIVFVGTASGIAGAHSFDKSTFLAGTGTLFVASIAMDFLPKYSHTASSPSTLTSALSLLINAILMSSVLPSSWPAILFWIVAGVILFIRCDTWCCLCLDKPGGPMLLPHSASTNVASIRLPRPPKGSVISARISAHR